VIEPGTKWSSYLVFAAGFIFLIVGVLVALTPLGYLLIAGVAIGGLIGKRPTTSRRPTNYTAPPRTAQLPPDRSEQEDHDDGFDIG
jgi:hypothetical protein